jgi:hypothetical protein
VVAASLIYTGAFEIVPLAFILAVVLKAVLLLLTSKPAARVTEMPPEILVPETVKLSADDGVP